MWLVAGVGRLLPGRMWDGLRARVEPDDPWDADDEFVPLDLSTGSSDHGGVETVADALRRTDCPVAPELFKGDVF